MVTETASSPSATITPGTHRNWQMKHHRSSSHLRKQVQDPMAHGTAGFGKSGGGLLAGEAGWRHGAESRLEGRRASYHACVGGRQAPRQLWLLIAERGQACFDRQAFATGRRPACRGLDGSGGGAPAGRRGRAAMAGRLRCQAGPAEPNARAGTGWPATQTCNPDMRRAQLFWGSWASRVSKTTSRMPNPPRGKQARRVQNDAWRCSPASWKTCEARAECPVAPLSEARAK